MILARIVLALFIGIGTESEAIDVEPADRPLQEVGIVRDTVGGKGVLTEFELLCHCDDGEQRSKEGTRLSLGEGEEVSESEDDEKEDSIEDDFEEDKQADVETT